MFILLSRRSVRRPVLIISILGFVVLGARYLKDVAYHSSYPPRVDMKTILRPGVTITRIRTSWSETTRTITAEPTAHDARERNEFRSEEEPGHSEPLQQHVYRPDGLMEVNPNGPHPIFELIKNAESEWEVKVAKSSKSLEDAVVEYKRWHKRPPLLGFDDWYAEIPPFFFPNRG